MSYAIVHLNYIAVIVTAVAGFLIGWLWYSPMLFANPWKEEMRITDEMMRAAMEKGMAGYFIKAFLCTLLSTFALAVLIMSRNPVNVVKGLEIGVFFGLLLVGMRMMNGGVWEQRSAKLMAIIVGHEVVLLSAQGALLGAWL